MRDATVPNPDAEALIYDTVTRLLDTGLLRGIGRSSNGAWWVDVEVAGAVKGTVGASLPTVLTTATDLVGAHLLGSVATDGPAYRDTATHVRRVLAEPRFRALMIQAVVSSSHAVTHIVMTGDLLASASTWRAAVAAAHQLLHEVPNA